MDKELITGLKVYAKEKGVSYISCSEFCKWLGISRATIRRHFGKWSNLCAQAGVNAKYNRTKDRNELFEILGKVWETLGRQPRAKEMKKPLSPISGSRYQREFGKSWYEVCLEFLSWKSGASVEEIKREVTQTSVVNAENSRRHKTKREVSLSLRYEVLKRDGFRCVKCGRSPATKVGVELHIDHILPCACGGETSVDNLQTLCSDCNLGKSDKLNSLTTAKPAK